MILEDYKKLRSDALNFFHAGIEVVKPDYLISSALTLDENNLVIKDIHGKHKGYFLNNYDRVFIIGAGKACSPMAKEIEKLFGNRIYKGFISPKYGFTEELDIINYIEAGHPLPDENSVDNANKIINLVKEANRNDLIINLVSGGSSSLLVKPASDISFEGKIQTSKVLLECGATIGEFNTIRKHISDIKGGKLAQSAFPATMINLIISDVIGDDLSVIGSGIGVRDESTYKDCIDIIEKYKIRTLLPLDVLVHLENGFNNQLAEKNPLDPKYFENVFNHLIGSNISVLNEIKKTAESFGYKTEIVSNVLDGEAKVVGKEIAREAINNVNHKLQCFIYGGETGVKLNNTGGVGGRNQELALAAAIELKDSKNIVILSAGTDGNDGPTDAAGAICDSKTFRRSFEKNLDAINYLEYNNSYYFFKQLKDLIITGPTNTNVMDIQIVLIS